VTAAGPPAVNAPFTGNLTLRVHGTPAPQGSKRAFAVRGKGGMPTGRIAVIESSHDRVKAWRAAVLDAALTAGLPAPLDGPLNVRIVFWLPRPRSHYGTGRNALRLRPGAPPLPAGPPDLSKLTRATEDALTDAGIWRDDAQVTHCRTAKRYAEDWPPGALIRISPDRTEAAPPPRAAATDP
jgi:Holliday junction resolvase RusA-like endonuclease